MRQQFTTYHGSVGGGPALWAAILLFACALLSLPLRFGIEPAWVLAGASASALALFAMRKWPLLLFAGLQFVGNLKTVPAQGFAITDPTVILLLLCLGAVLIQSLFAFAKLDDYDLTNLFQGQTAVALLFLMLLASITISVFYSPSSNALMKAVRFGVFDTLSFFFPILFLKSRKDVRQLIIAFVLLGFVLSAKVLSGLLNPSESMLEGDTDITKIGDGMMLSIALIMVLFSEIKLSVIFKYSSVALLSFGLVACAARSPLVAFFVAICVTAICASGQIGRRSRKSLLVGGGLIFAGVLSAAIWIQDLPVAQRKLESKKAELESVISGSLFTHGTVAQRLGFYRSALDAIAQHPIGGVGAAGWSIFYDNADVAHYPHNFVLEVGAEQGLLGMMILIVLLTLLLRSALHVLQGDASLAFVFPLFICCVFLNLMTGDIENRNLWCCLGLVAAASRLGIASTINRPISNLNFATAQ